MAIVTSGLLCLYDMTEGTGTNLDDLSSNNNDATLTTGELPDWVTEGLDFTGADSVTLPDACLPTTGGLTVMAVVKDVATSTENPLVGFDGTTEYTSWYLNSAYNSNRPLMFERASRYRYWEKDDPRPLHTGSHIVFFSTPGTDSTDISSARMMIDGVAQEVFSTLATETNARNADTGERRIGHDGPGRFLDAKMAIFGTWSRQLTEAEEWEMWAWCHAELTDSSRLSSVPIPAPYTIFPNSEDGRGSWPQPTSAWLIRIDEGEEIADGENQTSHTGWAWGADSSDAWVRVGFPSPPDDLATGADKQTFRAHIRRTRVVSHGANTPPQWRFEVHESSTSKQAGTNATITATTEGEIVEWTWDASNLTDVDGSGVQAYLYLTEATGAPTASGEIDWIEWVAELVGGSVALAGGFTSSTALGGAVDANASLAGGFTSATVQAGAADANASVAGDLPSSTALAGALDAPTAALAGGVASDTSLGGALDANVGLLGGIASDTALSSTLTDAGAVQLAGDFASSTTLGAALTANASVAGGLASDTSLGAGLTANAALAAGFASNTALIGAVDADVAIAAAFTSTTTLAASLSGDTVLPAASPVAVLGTAGPVATWTDSTSVAVKGSGGPVAVKD